MNKAGNVKFRRYVQFLPSTKPLIGGEVGTWRVLEDLILSPRVQFLHKELEHFLSLLKGESVVIRPLRDDTVKNALSGVGLSYSRATVTDPPGLTGEAYIPESKLMHHVTVAYRGHGDIVVHRKGEDQHDACLSASLDAVLQLVKIKDDRGEINYKHG